MAKSLLIATCIAFVLLLFAATSRSDVADPSAGLDAESIAAPITPKPGNEAPPRDPFTPYGVGGSQAEWRYEDLTDEEKEVADRGHETDAWGATHEVWEHALQERSRGARAEIAGRQLGVQNLSSLGVLP